MNWEQVKKFQDSLHLCDRHLCCDDAETYLYPPRKRGKIEFMTCFAMDHWYIDIGDGGPIVNVRFCPFCGEKLEEVRQ